jgi:hypothetical protein
MRILLLGKSWVPASAGTNGLLGQLPLNEL